MARLDVVEYLDGYARSFAAPVESHVTVTAVEPTDVSGWQPAQFASCGCVPPVDVVVGGAPWHDVQVTFASY